MEKNVHVKSLHGAWETNQSEDARKRSQASSIAAAEAGLAFIASQAERKRVPRVTRRGAVRRLGGAALAISVNPREASSLP